MKFFSLPFVLFLIFILGFNFEILAQPCVGGNATETLDAANSNIVLSSSGIWAFDNNENIPAYGWPKTTSGSVHKPGVLFTGNLWMSGFDEGLNLKFSGKTYGLDDFNGYWPGPLNEDGTTTTSDCINWDRLFKVNGVEIDNFKSDFADNQQLDDPVPMSILGWPGKGNLSFSSIHGFELPDADPGLAPFFDRNGDGVYNPLMGDYPEVKCADQAVWWVFNDVGNINFTGSDPVRMEIQMMAYVYSSNLDNVNNASFYDVKTIYRGNSPLDSFYMGIWLDPDLGCSFDDYIGYSIEEDLAYVYNQDNLDGLDDGTCLGDDSYNEPPMLGLKILRKPFDDFGDELEVSSFLLYGGFGAEPPIINPTFAYPGEFYHLLSGSKDDGSPLLNPSGEITKFLFSDSPDDPDGWSMCSSEIENNDYRLLLSIGPNHINNGETNEMTFAIVVQPQSELPCPDITDLVNAADLPVPFRFSNFYCNLTVNTNEEDLNKINLNVFPNPTSNQLNFQLFGVDHFLIIHLYQMDGQLVKEIENFQTTTTTILTEDLVAGTYIYHIQTRNGKSISGKIVLE